MDTPLPRSIAIAGAWGYIGRRFLDAAASLNVPAYVFDPGPLPDDVDATTFERIDDEDAFYGLDTDFYHLALHPKHRAKGLAALFERARSGDCRLVLNEKPMADPERPDHCAAIARAVAESGLTLLYDFLELFDPMTQHINAFLSQFEEIRISTIEMHRSKDREDPENPRNRKIIVPIQYQESVHCVAFCLNLLGHRAGGLDALWHEGVTVSGRSEPYDPPNPEDYPYVVDGKLDGSVRLGDTEIRFDTNFKRGAPWTKRRCIQGVADGEPFIIEAEYLEGNKWLRINGEDQGFPPDADSYANTIRQAWAWTRQTHRPTLMTGVYPNPPFARATYLISAMLWDSCAANAAVSLPDGNVFARYAPGFPAAVPGFPRYDS